MVKRGRPRRTQVPVVVNIKLLLYPGQDDDLLAYFRAIPPRGRASAVKTAMRSGNVDAAQINDADENEMIDAFEDLLL